MKEEDFDISTAMEQILADSAGQDIEEYRAARAEHLRISERSLQYVGKPSSEWPEILFNWDLSIEGQRYSLDGMSQKEFAEHFPEGFLLGHVLLNELDKRLCQYSRRDDGELWGIGFDDKLAFLIVYLSKNRKISPPLVKPLEKGRGHIKRWPSSVCDRQGA